MIQYLYRLIRLLLLALAMALVLPAFAGLSVDLPTRFDPDDVLLLLLPPPATPKVELQAGGNACGLTNISPLHSIEHNGQQPHQLTGSTAYAEDQLSQWYRVLVHEWWVEYGSGLRDIYTGNRDAGQLWVDLHVHDAQLGDYQPVVTTAHIRARWLGLGQQRTFDIGTLHGEGLLLLRGIIVDDYLTRAINGDVSSMNYAGTAKLLDSAGAEGQVNGYGWALDSRVSFTTPGGWCGQLCVEGALGEIAWHGISVEDIDIISSGTYVDPAGFLHQIGGASGAQWADNVTAHLNPAWRFDLVSPTHPNLLVGVSGQYKAQTSPYLGAAWPRHARWMPLLRWYPTLGMVEVGVASRGCQLRLAADSLNVGNLQHVELSLQLDAFVF